MTAIAISGGVDSAVAAYECTRLGHTCIGVTMRLPCGDTSGAENIAKQLGIPLHIWDARPDFEQWVIEPFAHEYLHGRTPNPCIACNSRIKFGGLARFAEGLGADKLATGHYARVKPLDHRFFVQKAHDTQKDQSYYLYGLSQAQLQAVLFPLGGYTKAQVREIARQQGFANADSPESQDICFVPDGDYASFINQKTPCVQPGLFTDTAGHIIGQHKGHIHFTVGQRKGLGIAWHTPLYVLEKDAQTNTVILGEDKLLFSDTLTAAACSWSIPAPAAPFRARARIRCRQREAEVTITPLGADGASFRFDQPQRAIAKGQHVVVYDDDIVIGGGVIA
jgi:tRNA-specific 2-thiouridylase